jgi:ABC-type cobalamin transport system ATPase subunit
MRPLVPRICTVNSHPAPPCDNRPPQDISTNLVVVIGPNGSGRSALAAALASDLVATGHWVEAYWTDLGGVATATTAGARL